MNAMTVVPASFNGQAPSKVFANQQNANDLSEGISGGYGLIKYRGKVWSIQHNGQTQQLMRDDGDGPRGSIDVVIVKANPHLSKTWYENGYTEGNDNPPDCASANGVTPDAGVPKKQSNICAQCPRNAWGTAPNGGRGKACGDHRRMAVLPLTDLKNEYFGGPLLLRCPAASLQDMAAFDAKYRQLGYPYFSLGVKIGFDATESYPKFTFQAIRPLSDAEANIVVAWQQSPEVMRIVSEENVVAAPAQQPHVEEPAFLEPAPTTAVRPNGNGAGPMAADVSGHQGAGVAGAQQPQPVAGATAASNPMAQAGGFGPSVAGAAPDSSVGTAGGVRHGGSASGAAAIQQTGAAHPAVTPQPTSQTAPPVKMTGFGGVATPAGNGAQQAAQPQQTAQPQQVQQVEPATQPVVQAAPEAFDATLDERLSKLLG
jgi:hypothetical protein